MLFYSIYWHCQNLDHPMICCICYLVIMVNSELDLLKEKRKKKKLFHLWSIQITVKLIGRSSTNRHSLTMSLRLMKMMTKIPNSNDRSLLFDLKFDDDLQCHLECNPSEDNTKMNSNKMVERRCKYENILLQCPSFRFHQPLMTIHFAIAVVASNEWAFRDVIFRTRAS